MNEKNRLSINGLEPKNLMREVLTKISIGVAPLKNHWHNLREYIKEELMIKQPVAEEEFQNYSLATLVEKARQEWEQTKIVFNEVNDPELIDHAIFAMEAAERKYMYLLKKAKKEKVVNNRYLVHTEQ